MTISSSYGFSPDNYQIFPNQKTKLANFDTQLAKNTDEQQTAQLLKERSTSDSKDLANNFVSTFAYAPNVSAIFNAYLEKQRLTSSTDSKIDSASQRLESNGMDKKQAQSYAKLSVDIYKQILEAQLNSKISEQVAQQKEFKQKTQVSTTANPYVQMTGSLVNLYS